ncbi:MAG: hypothetical protein SVZ03_16640 [Spirochaetota bacterium]|nr:hypothetical protein [Spirochaetota bacterium]
MSKKNCSHCGAKLIIRGICERFVQSLSGRLKLTGIRWTLQHANAMARLRCKYFEDRWHNFWNSINSNDYIREHGKTHVIAA